MTGLRRRMLRVLVVLVTFGVLAVSPGAAHAGRPLLEQDVIRSVDATHPGLETADASVDAARARNLSARGAWDPFLSVEAQWNPLGYYDNGQVGATVTQATPLWGLGVYAAYRLGWGDYPAYKGDLQTRSGGEVRAGVSLPLWKDGPIDERRAGVGRTRALERATRCEREVTRLSLFRDAARAYWGWVAAGQEVQIQRDLLRVAWERDEGLRAQAELGSLPPIVVVDNERLVLDRQSKLVAAEREFREAALALSLFLRDDRGAPVTAEESRVPDLGVPTAIDLPELDADVEDALRRRPEICALENARAAAVVQRRLARNQRAPRLDARSFVARDLGPGPTELGQTELGVGIVVELPLALRKARGEYRAASAEVRRLDAQTRGLRDRIAVEVRRARVGLTATAEQAEMARRQVLVARTLAAAEREKLEEGASDLVILNLRELAVADAERLEVEAVAAHERARVEYLTAVGRRPAR